MAGNTPWKGYRKRKGDADKKILSRIIGVEVHCGPIHGTMLYYVDNLVAGGSNLIIEITRQGAIKFLMCIIDDIYYINCYCLSFINNCAAVRSNVDGTMQCFFYI